MTKTIQKAIVLAVLAGLGFYVYANYLTACTQTLYYDIGEIDPRFGITEEEFVKLVQETETVWEKPFGTEFFQYNPDAKFKINLIFDDRQQKTIDERNSRSNISSKEQAYLANVAEYEGALAVHNETNDKYEAAVDAYEQRLNKYNQDVDHWNRQGGAPNQEYNRLQQEKRFLQSESKRLENERQKLNSEVTALNSMIAIINSQAKDLNFDVNAYNGTFGTTREFDQGSYSGNAIDIYQFSTQEDLRLVVAHELGHALGIDHVEDPNAIMYYLMDKQNIKNLHLSATDISAVRSSCNL